jgi:hypothetical protein
MQRVVVLKPVAGKSQLSSLLKLSQVIISPPYANHHLVCQIFKIHILESPPPPAQSHAHANLGINILPHHQRVLNVL